MFLSAHYELLFGVSLKGIGSDSVTTFKLINGLWG